MTLEKVLLDSMFMLKWIHFYSDEMPKRHEKFQNTIERESKCIHFVIMTVLKI